MATTVHPNTVKVLGALKARYSELKLRLLRDAFAGLAVPGLLSSGKYDLADDARTARSAYAIADALIAARGGKDQP